MAGKRLYELMTQRGGKPSDYTDVVYGTVISAKPLKVQLSNNMVLTDDFIVLGKHIGKAFLKEVAKVVSAVFTHVHSPRIFQRRRRSRGPSPASPPAPQSG